MHTLVHAFCYVPCSFHWTIHSHTSLNTEDKFWEMYHCINTIAHPYTNLGSLPFYTQRPYNIYKWYSLHAYGEQPRTRWTRHSAPPVRFPGCPGGVWRLRTSQNQFGACHQQTKIHVTSTEAWTQGLRLATQALYHLSHPSSPNKIL
jgi:hypothetical protein